jgi:hypothetical protein
VLARDRRRPVATTACNDRGAAATAAVAAAAVLCVSQRLSVSGSLKWHPHLESPALHIHHMKRWTIGMRVPLQKKYHLNEIYWLIMDPS